MAWPDVYKRYATSVRRIDDGVGDILQTLKDLGMTNSLVVFSSDNGPSIESYLQEKLAADFFDSFGPFDGVKRDLLEGGLRVPTIAWWPNKIPAGQVSAQPAQSHDWMPTFAEAAGVSAPARSDGVSLMPTLVGRGKQKPTTVYSEYFNASKTPDYAEFSEAHRGRKRGQMQSLRIGSRWKVVAKVGLKAPGLATAVLSRAKFNLFFCAANPEKLDHFLVAQILGEIQRGSSVAPFRIHIRTFIDQ